VGLPMHSPAGSVSALSFRDLHIAQMRPSSEISSIAGHAASEIIAKQTQLINAAAPKIAGTPNVGNVTVSVPVTPDKFNGVHLGKSPFEMASMHNIGQLSPGMIQTHPAHQTWHVANGGAASAAANSAMALTANLSPPVLGNKIASPAADSGTASGKEQSIDNAVSEAQLSIVKEAQPAQAAAPGSGSASGDAQKSSSSKADGKAQAGGSNSSSSSATVSGTAVSKKTANQLFSVIKGWYPEQAGKLAGMLMANHTEKAVAKYLRHEDRLRDKMEHYLKLLSTTQVSQPPAHKASD